MHKWLGKLPSQWVWAPVRSPARHLADFAGWEPRGDWTNAMARGERLPTERSSQAMSWPRSRGKGSSEAPSGRSCLCFLERWAQVGGHPFWHVLWVRLQTQLVPKGPSASPPHQAALYGTTLAPRSFALRPVSPSCCLLTIQPEATSCPICLCLSLNWSSPPPLLWGWAGLASPAANPSCTGPF